jgi:hypothetical protein
MGHLAKPPRLARLTVEIRDKKKPHHATCGGICGRFGNPVIGWCLV